MLYKFCLDRYQITDSVQNICSIISKRTVFCNNAKIFFTKFKNSNFCLDEANHNGQPLKLDKICLLEFVKEDL